MAYAILHTLCPVDLDSCAGIGYSYSLPFPYISKASNATVLSTLQTSIMLHRLPNLLLTEMPLMFTIGILYTNSLLQHHCLKHLDYCNKYLRALGDVNNYQSTDEVIIDITEWFSIPRRHPLRLFHIRIRNSTVRFTYHKHSGVARKKKLPRQSLYINLIERVCF